MQQVGSKKDRGTSVIQETDEKQAHLMAMKRDLADKQREFQAAKSDRASIEQQVWHTDDLLKEANVEVLKDE